MDVQTCIVYVRHCFDFTRKLTSPEGLDTRGRRPTPKQRNRNDSARIKIDAYTRCYRTGFRHTQGNMTSYMRNHFDLQSINEVYTPVLVGVVKNWLEAK